MKAIKFVIYIIAALLLVPTDGFTQSLSYSDSNKEIDRIHDMILKSDFKQLKNHIKNEGGVNVTDEVGNTPLIFAAKIGDKQTVDMLINQGADVNHQNHIGATALMLAAKYGNKYTVKTLLEHGADPSIQNDSGYTAYIFAKAYGNEDILHLLQ